MNSSATNLSLRLFNRETGERIGRLIDITPEGLMIISHESLGEQKEFELAMVLPNDMDGPTTLSLKATSIWTQESKYTNSFSTGFSITGLKESDEAVLRALVAST